MGNFELNEPTEAQLNALTKLSTALMIKYHINPDSEIYAHIDDDHEPYVKDIIRTSFIGHRDTGKTACPGKNLYSKLPIIKQAIRTQLLIKKKNYPIKKVRVIHNITETKYFEKDNGTLSIEKPITNSIKSCISYNTNIIIDSCIKKNNILTINLIKKKDKL